MFCKKAIMNVNETLPLQAYHFEEVRRESFTGNRHLNRLEKENEESTDSYLKTIAEIDEEFESAAIAARPMRNDLELPDEMIKDGYNETVNPGTLDHGFMEENY
jgi:hypothetical protein